MDTAPRHRARWLPKYWAAATMALLTMTGGVAAQSLGRDQANDPKGDGVMQGFPPPQAMRVNKTNAFERPYMRWAFRHARETSPTAGIRHAPTPMNLPEQPVGNLDDVQFSVEGRPVKLADYLRDTHTDGFIVLHKGRIVLERYLDGFGPAQPHIWASMTKSVTGLMAAMLIVEGRLDPEARLATYVPELTGNPFGDATLEKNLDMEVAVAYAPALPPDLGLFGAVGIIPRRAGTPDNIYDFLKTVSADTRAVTADYWFYQNGSPEAVAWAMRRISGKSWAELAQERIWSKLAQDDAYIQVDSLGTEMASGGLSTTLRDAARFADAVRRAHAGDASAGISVQAVRVALRPRENQAGFATGRLAAGKPGYAYGDYWYQVNDGDGSVEAGGRFGQKIYINPRKELTVVKFSSSPDAAPRNPTADTGGNVAAHSRPLESSTAFIAAIQAVYAAIPR
ncbi:serine hydrolase domain-containing protein [Cupriavidus basilensis]|uniref:Beta-lactamase class C and other penicillin binding protein n=1 Tax=Cupriavidus basilensis TaxID=68895 RepID=A0A0C4YQT1_9BURK|nr:serine hydrolase [Cupriavidus basilensis]AJG24369.1 Beta-lactamase class C and other penicillin binding protein [Cupriavidus basilensis]